MANLTGATAYPWPDALPRPLDPASLLPPASRLPAISTNLTGTLDRHESQNEPGSVQIRVSCRSSDPVDDRPGEAGPPLWTSGGHLIQTWAG